MLIWESERLARRRRRREFIAYVAEWLGESCPALYGLWAELYPNEATATNPKDDLRGATVRGLARSMGISADELAWRIEQFHAAVMAQVNDRMLWAAYESSLHRAEIDAAHARMQEIRGAGAA